MAAMALPRLEMVESLMLEMAMVGLTAMTRVGAMRPMRLKMRGA